MKSASRTGNAYAAILAGGSGTRMGNPDKPKQFLMLGSKPILVHTVEKFCVSGEFDAVLVLCPETWVQQTKDLLAKYSPHYAQEVTVIAGGCYAQRHGDECRELHRGLFPRRRRYRFGDS